MPITKLSLMIIFYSRYVLDSSGLVIDLLSGVPLVLRLIYGFKMQNSNLRYFYLLKIFRLVKYYKYQLGRKYNINISTFRYKITISISSFCLMAHMLACIFYTISPCVPLEDSSDLCPRKSLAEETWTHTCTFKVIKSKD